jgi:hypothetical protein
MIRSVWPPVNFSDAEGQGRGATACRWAIGM